MSLLGTNLSNRKSIASPVPKTITKKGLLQSPMTGLQELTQITLTSAHHSFKEWLRFALWRWPSCFAWWFWWVTQTENFPAVFGGRYWRRTKSRVKQLVVALMILQCLKNISQAQLWVGGRWCLVLLKNFNRLVAWAWSCLGSAIYFPGDIRNSTRTVTFLAGEPTKFHLPLLLGGCHTQDIITL